MDYQIDEQFDQGVGAQTAESTGEEDRVSEPRAQEAAPARGLAGRNDDDVEDSVSIPNRNIIEKHKCWTDIGSVRSAFSRLRRID